jgi:hypothetical protein
MFTGLQNWFKLYNWENRHIQTDMRCADPFIIFDRIIKGG